MIKKTTILCLFFVLAFSPLLTDSTSLTNDSTFQNTTESSKSFSTATQSVMETLKTPQEIVRYINANFIFIHKTGTLALEPEILIRIKSGGEQDFAFFTAQTLQKNKYLVSFVFVYEYLENNQKKNRYLVVFNENGTPQYFHFNAQGAHFVESYGWNFLELCQKEQNRTGLEITRYGTVAVNSSNLVPSNWDNVSIPLERETILPVEEKPQEEVAPEIETKEEASASAKEIVSSLKTSQAAIQYLNSNFKVVPRTGTSVNPEKFISDQSKRGEQDWASFTSYSLQSNNLTTVILSYKYLDQSGQEISKYVVSFNENGIPKYVYFDTNGAQTVQSYGNSFIDICRKEEQRINARITQYGIISPLATNLVPAQWSNLAVQATTTREQVSARETVPTVSPETPARETVPTVKPEIPVVVPLKEIAQGREAVKVYQEEVQQGRSSEERKIEVKEVIKELAVITEEEAEKIEEFEDPRTQGLEIYEIYEVVGVVVSEKVVREDGREDVKSVIISGKGPPDSIIFLFIYSTPMIARVKTDSQGNWSYLLEKELEDGTHEIYVASVDNTGKIVAKSSPVPFVKEAAAVQIGFVLSPIVETEEPGFFSRNLFFLLSIVFLLIILMAIIALGVIGSKKKETRNV
jgi:hypothetical protein